MNIQKVLKLANYNICFHEEHYESKYADKGYMYLQIADNKDLPVCAVTVDAKGRVHEIGVEIHTVREVIAYRWQSRKYALDLESTDKDVNIAFDDVLFIDVSKKEILNYLAQAMINPINNFNPSVDVIALSETEDTGVYEIKLSLDAYKSFKEQSHRVENVIKEIVLNAIKAEDKSDLF